MKASAAAARGGGGSAGTFLLPDRRPTSVHPEACSI
jgi:hypothetical protein